MAVDEDDQEVLIHFDRWNSRFDEWLDMRSESLRAVPTSQHDPSEAPSMVDVSKQLSVIATQVNPRLPFQPLTRAVKLSNGNVLIVFVIW